MKVLIIGYFYRSALQGYFFVPKATYFNQPSFCIRCMLLITFFRISNILAKNNIFDHAGALKVIIFPSRVKLFHFRILKKLFQFQFQLLYHMTKKIPNICTASLVRSITFKITFKITFSDRLLANQRFDKLDFKIKDKNTLIILSKLSASLAFLKKKIKVSL